VWQEIGRLDSADRTLYQPAEFLALLVGDRGLQILNLQQSLANEYDLSDFGDAGHPGVADQLRIEGQQSLRLLRVATR
jgi:hypothetical protein